jgi:hypothetical protein
MWNILVVAGGGGASSTYGVAAVLAGIVVLLLANLLEAVHQPNLLYCFSWVLLTP